MNIYKTAMLSLMTLFLSTSARAEITKDGDDSSVTATVLGPAGMVVDAKNFDVTVDDSGPALRIIVPSAGFKTGLDIRDRHLTKAIEAKKYPTVTITLKDVDIKIPDTEDTEKGTIPATLEFHGVTKSIRIEYVASQDCDGHIGVKADFDIDIRDYGITPPSYLGVGVKPNVHMHTWLRLIDIDGC